MNEREQRIRSLKKIILALEADIKDCQDSIDELMTMTNEEFLRVKKELEL